MLRDSTKWLFDRAFSIGVAMMLLGAGVVARAQTPPLPQQSAPGQSAPAATLSPAQLDDLVAPIALYPDPLLGQVLVASTYPLEVVEAQQWLSQNPNLAGQQLMDAARQQDWDPSVQALAAFPDVLAKLSQDVQWTTALGNAFLAQQTDVMSAVQQMRVQAQNNGKLYSTPQQTIIPENQGGQSAVAIQPVDPQVIYVPAYDPAYIWGPPAYGFYPPLYYPAYGFGFGPAIDIGFFFGGWGGWGGWGWGPNWFGHTVFVNGNFFNRFGFRHDFRPAFAGRTAWAHDPNHRLGVPYSNHQLANRFQAASAASRANLTRQSIARNSFRQPWSGNRNGFQTSRPGPAQFGNRAFQGNRSAAAPAMTGRMYSAPQRYQTRSYQAPQQTRSSSPGVSRSASPNVGRSFGGGARSFASGGHASGGGGHTSGGSHNSGHGR